MYSYAEVSIVSLSLREVLSSVDSIYLQIVLLFKDAGCVIEHYMLYLTVDLQVLWIANLIM